MSVLAVIGIAIAAALIGVAGGYWATPHRRRVKRTAPTAVRRILLPFTGQAISRRSFEAAVRLAKAENAVIMPTFLATVPMNLPLDTLCRRSAGAGCRCWRRSNSEPWFRECPWIRVSPAGAHRATRCAN